MRKLYAFLFAMFVMASFAIANDITVTPTATEGSAEGISFTTQKNDGGTAPAFNTNNSDLRIYAKGSITVTNTDGNITKIVFNLSAQGKKRLAPITASTGTVAEQAAGDETVEWTGDASEVTFTVGEKADFGSEGSSKAGQLCFTDFIVTVGEADPNFVAAPRITPSTGTYYSAQEVTISVSDSTAAIYYTTDGSKPTAASTTYTAPFTVSQTTTVKAIAIKGENSSEVVESVITIESLSTQTIAAVIAAGAAAQAQTTGTVLAIYPNGLMLGDDTGYITVYIGAAPEVAVGDVVSVVGKTAVYGGCLQFDRGATVTKTGKGTASYPTAAATNGVELDSLVAKPIVTYIKVRGTLNISGNYKNLTVEGAKAVGSVLCTDEVLGEAKSGDIIDVTGFYAYVNGSTTKYANIIATSIEIVSGGTPIVIPEYTTIQAMQDTAQVLGTSKVDIKYTFSNVTVTYVNSKNVYVNDGTRGLLLYGTNSKNLKAGDKISGSVTGKLQLYSGLTELGDVDYSAIEVAEGEAPAPETIGEVGPIIADATRLQYENKLMTIEGIQITAEEDTTGNATFYIIDESDNMLPLFFKNANDFKDLLIDFDATYNVTGIVGNHNGVQLAPRTVADFVNVSEIGLQTPESGWDVENLIVALGDSVAAHFTTNSDATVTYLSEDETVATIDENGKITIVGPGQTEISAETEATQTYKSDYKSFILTVTSGANGTINNPYTVSDVLAFTIASKNDTIQTNAWVKGYIIGFVSNNKLIASADSAIATNIAIAAAADETASFIPVELPKGNVRTALNLADVPSNLGKEVWLCGTITQYFGMNGLKQVKNFSFDGTDTVRSITAPAAANDAIYTLSGQRVSAITKAGIYIVGGRKVVVK
ncbi:MAG: chitobiase/beta-hexosaminidase C-terminal domain-containing protein [Bacteroidaceae bacterium]|nr:chitobiase/beta-hexosaminidase C-terminal domain-containing protein [Bacteroidaceae bacterium]